MQDPFPYYSIGHFINQPDSKTAFEITRFEEMEEPEVDDVHKHTFYEILWVDEGKSRQTIDYQSYNLGAGSLFFISPGQVHEFEEWQPLKGGTIMFTADFFLLNQQNRNKLFELSFLDNFYGNPDLQPDDHDFHEIRHTIDLLIRENKRADRDPAILQSYLHVLVSQIQRSINTKAHHPLPSRHLILFKEFQSRIEEKYRENLTVSDYASHLNITQHHLNHVVKQVTGKTATEVIRARSILEARRFLTFTDHTVSQIAAELGWYDSSYFTRLFRKETGMTPVEFRARMSE